MRDGARAGAAALARTGRLFWAAFGKFDRDKGFFLAAAVAFSIFLSVIPLSLLLLSILGTWLSNDAEVAEHLANYLQLLTPSLDPQITESLLKIVRHRRIVGVVGLAGLAWTSTIVFSSLRISLNVIFGVARSRGTLRALGVDLLMILLSGSMLLASMLLTSWVSFLQRYGVRHLPQIGPIASFLLKYPAPLLFTVLMCLMVYMIAPNRRIPLLPSLKAAVFTGLFWEIAKQLFGWYVLHLGSYSLIYGSLGTVAVFVFWIYYSAVIFLLGAEIAAALEDSVQSAGLPDRRPFLPQ